MKREVGWGEGAGAKAFGLKRAAGVRRAVSVKRLKTQRL